MGFAQKIFEADLDYLVGEVRAGRSKAAVAREFGATRATVDRALKRGGLPLASRYRAGLDGVRDRVADMALSEAVDYLLDLLELAIPDLDTARLGDLLSAGFTAHQARVLLVLESATGRAVTRDHIAARVARGADECSVSSVDVHVVKIRKRLASLGWPVALQTVWGLGYRLEILDPAFRLPGAAFE